jgi:hypothetical protein
VKTAFFGEILLDDAEALLADGGIHGVQGHRIALSAGAQARWERRLDGLHPSGTAGTGEVTLAPEERARVQAWLDDAWVLAGSGWRQAYDLARGPPRRVWVIALRIGGETRCLEGHGSDIPAAVAPLLDWLVRRVNALAV